MKKLITKISEGRGTFYETWAELQVCTRPHNTACLRFSTVWSGAKNATQAQTKSEFFLDSEGRQQLRELLDRWDQQ